MLFDGSRENTQVEVAIGWPTLSFLGHQPPVQSRRRSPKDMFSCATLFTMGGQQEAFASRDQFSINRR